MIALNKLVSFFFGILVFFSLFVSSLSGQTTLLSDPGLTYGNSDGPTGPDVYAVDISNCTSISLSLDFSFSQPWEGSGNLEYCDELNASSGMPVCIGSPPCNCDPNFAAVGACNNCWDFLWVRFNVDGVTVQEDLIGGPGTTDADQMGSLSLDNYCTNGASSADLTIVTQTWAAAEAVTFSNIMIVCWEGAPSIFSNNPICGTGDLLLNGSANDASVVQSWQWTNTGTGMIASPNDQNTFSSNPQNGEIYTLTTTDVNGCTGTNSLTVTSSGGPTINNPNLPTICSTDATCFDLTSFNAVVNPLGLTVNWFDGNPSAGGIFNATPSCTNLTTLVNPLYVQVISGTCSAELMVPFTIAPALDPFFVFDDFCVGSLAAPSFIQSPGGIFSFNPAPGDGATINPSTGVISDATAGSTYSVQYTTNGACSASSVLSVSASGSDASFSLSDFCEGSPNSAMGIVTPGGTFSFSIPPGDGAFVDPFTGSISNGFPGATYSVQYTTPGVCSSSEVETVTVLPAEDASFLLPPFCAGNPLPASGIVTPGGTFVFNPFPGDGATVDPFTGIINNAMANTTYFVEYTTSGACAGSSIQSVMVSPADDPSFLLTDFCAGEANQASGIITPGGLFSFNPPPGDGATLDPLTGTISNGLANSTYFVAYTTSGLCSGSTTNSVNVLPADDANFNYPATVCVSAPNPLPFVFPISPGTFSVNNGASIDPNTGELDLSSVAVGVSYTISYQTLGVCPAVEDQSILIDPAEDASFTYPNAVCIGAINPVPSTFPLFPGTFSVDNGASINPNTGELDLSSTLEGQNYNIVFTTSGTCTGINSVTISVNSVDDASFTYPNSECINGNNPTPSIAP
ncbi:MAG: hypothetical protein AAGD05_05305, partial [Bacteroidota bacterium]